MASVSRVVKLVENTERRQKVLKRWKPGEGKFNAAALSLEMRRNEAVIESTYALANERMFLISLKKKYAGNKWQIDTFKACCKCTQISLSKH